MWNITVTLGRHICTYVRTLFSGCVYGEAGCGCGRARPVCGCGCMGLDLTILSYLKVEMGTGPGVGLVAESGMEFEAGQGM